VLRATGDTETAQENIQNWFELDEGDPRYQLLTEKEIVALIFCHQHYLDCKIFHLFVFYIFFVFYGYLLLH
jgi:hypothetical protein